MTMTKTEQKEMSNRIAMSLLVQCAWVWEHCTQNPNEGEFKLTDVVQGLIARNRTNTKPGWTMVEMGLLWECREHFADGIDGLKYFDRETCEVTLEFGAFHCSYWLTDIYKITKAFCQGNACQSLMNNTVFGYTDGERWVRLPGTPKTVKKAEKKKAKVVVKQIAQPKQTKGVTAPLSIADRLREALRARLAA